MSFDWNTQSNHNNVANYQLSGLPYTGKISFTGNTEFDLSLPRVSRWITLQAVGGDVTIYFKTGNHANATGVMFLVNVIHEQSWFNLTGVNGGNFFDGAGIGATHNQTWDYQVIYSDWKNRTVRLVWEETGADSSSGEEYPERSPIEITPEPPEYEEALGNLTISRETGLMPIPMHPGDKVRLDGQDGLTLVVTAGYPDMRKVINELQRMSIDGKLSVDKDGMIHNEFKLQFLDAIRNGESLGTIRKMVADSNFTEYTELYRLLYDEVESFGVEKMPEIIADISKGSYQDVLVVDKEINFIATVSQILGRI